MLASHLLKTLRVRSIHLLHATWKLFSPQKAHRSKNTGEPLSTELALIRIYASIRVLFRGQKMLQKVRFAFVRKQLSVAAVCWFESHLSSQLGQQMLCSSFRSWPLTMARRTPTRSKSRCIADHRGSIQCSRLDLAKWRPTQNAGTRCRDAARERRLFSWRFISYG